MQLSARSYLIAGVAVASTGVIAAAPVVAPMPLSPLWIAAAQPDDGGLGGDDDLGVDVTDGGADVGVDLGGGVDVGVDLGSDDDIDVGVDLGSGDDDGGTGSGDPGPITQPDVDVDLGGPGGDDDGGIGSGDPDPEREPDAEPEPDADRPLTLGEVIRGEIRSGIRVVSEGGGAANDVARVVLHIPARVNANVREGVPAPQALGRASNDAMRAVGTATNRVIVAANGYIRPRLELAGVVTHATGRLSGAAIAAGASTMAASVASAADVVSAPLRRESLTTALNRSTDRVSATVSGARRTLNEVASTGGRDITRAIRSAQADPTAAARASSARASAAEAASASSRRAADD